jgi:uncharacterized Zn finger protein
MFLLFGLSTKQHLLTVVSFVCHFCGVNAQQNVVKRSNRFTLFFVPLFSVGTKYYNECTNCGGVTSLTRDQATHAQDWAIRHVTR